MRIAYSLAILLSAISLAAASQHSTTHSITTTFEQEAVLLKAAQHEELADVTVYLQRFVSGLANQYLQQEALLASREEKELVRLFKSLVADDQQRVNTIIGR